MTHSTDELHNGLTILGAKVSSDDTQGRLETFPNPTRRNGSTLAEVVLKTDEVYANCPITAQPDFYSLEISYFPREKCVESKSAKLYIHRLRDSGIFGEALACKIADDFFEALDPFHIMVSLTQRPRGGISIVSTATRFSDEVTE